MKVRNIVTNKNARYYILGEPGPHIRQIWFVCHGYGQLAGEFLQNFEVIKKRDLLIVAPEGLHRFYLYRGTGKVGASWMTSEDRLKDIEDYIYYLDKVCREILSLCNTAKTTISALGFSQGTATACRWALQGKSSIQRLILWGGYFPPDTPWETSRHRLNTIKTQFIFGEQDPYIKPEFHPQQLALLRQKKVNFDVKTFKGHHEIKANILIELANE